MNKPTAAQHDADTLFGTGVQEFDARQKPPASGGMPAPLRLPVLRAASKIRAARENAKGNRRQEESDIKAALVELCYDIAAPPCTECEMMQDEKRDYAVRP